MTELDVFEWQCSTRTPITYAQEVRYSHNCDLMFHNCERFLWCADTLCAVGKPVQKLPVSFKARVVRLQPDCRRVALRKAFGQAQDQHADAPDQETNSFPRIASSTDWGTATQAQSKHDCLHTPPSEMALHQQSTGLVSLQADQRYTDSYSNFPGD